MSHHDDGRRAGAFEQDDVGRRIREAGPRPEPPAADLAAIREAAEASWRGTVARRRRGRAAWIWAAAAGLAAAALVAWWWSGRVGAPGPSAPEVASLELAVGDVRVGDVPIGGGGGAVAADALTEGVWVATAPADAVAPGRAALRLGDGPALRLDTGTRVRLVEATRVELAAGALYLDSEVSPASPPVAVDTPYGTVLEIGTRFEVRLADDRLEVRVRDGRVSVEGGGREHAAAAGEELRLAADGSVARASLQPWADAWDWTARAAPPFDIEGAELGAYLDWIASETGRAIVWEDPALEAASRPIRLHGSIDGLTPEESLEIVLPGSALAGTVENGTIRLSRAG